MSLPGPAAPREGAGPESTPSPSDTVAAGSAADHVAAAHPAGELDREVLREALLPPEVPLPAPSTVAEAALRVRDLVALGRAREARWLAESFAGDPAPVLHRVALLEALAQALRATGDDAGAEAALKEAVQLVFGTGRHDHARALARTWGLAPTAVTGSPEADGAAPASAPAVRRGRRRAEPVRVGAEAEIDEAVLVVVAGAALPAPELPRSGSLDPRVLDQEEGRFEGALNAIAEVRSLVLGDPEPALRLGKAEVARLRDDPQAAVGPALEVIEAAEAAEDPLLDRLAVRARGVLAWALRGTDPAGAVSHALAALGDLRLVDDPALRVGLICDLVPALIAADQGRHATYAARRLDSLRRTLRDPADQVRPLLVVAAEAIAAGRADAASAPITEARRLARRERDRHGLLRADGLAAEAHRRAGRPLEAAAALRDAARSAQYLGDDLGTSLAERGRLLATELDLRADAMGLALDAGDAPGADGDAVTILTRLARTSGRPVLDAADGWQRAVDARIGRLLAAAVAAAGTGAADARARLAVLRDGASATIDAAPAGIADRTGRVEASRAYLEDRFAAAEAMLEGR